MDAPAELLDLGLKIAGIVASAALVIASAYIKKKTGIDIEAGKKVIESGNRDALGTALETATTLALGKGLIGKLALDFVLDYVERSSPEATRMAKKAGVLLDKAEAALTKPAVKQVQDIIKATGSDKLADALKKAQSWNPPANEGRP